MKKDDKVTEKKRSKIVSMIHRMWEKFRSIDWKDPLNRWKLLAFSVVAFIGIAGFSYGAVAGTSTTSFCSNCHEMSPEYVTHVSTTHSEIKCSYCHIEPGIGGTIKGKLAAMTEVYHHVTRTQPDPIYATKPIKDIVCLRCHSTNRDITPSGDLIVNHQGHIEEGISCVTCHSGVAHGKIVERGLNTSDTYDYWIEENADKLLSTEYIRTNMGTCIDCHDQVNQGLEPWNEKEFLLSIPPSQLDGETPTSKEILENVVLKQFSDAQISMECTTCHLEVTIPDSHSEVDWGENHVMDALNEFDQCLTCHQEEKWVKRVQPQSIESLLENESFELDSYVPDFGVVQKEMANTVFCVSCHTEK